MKSPSFKAELDEYKEWVATWSLAPVDQWQQKLALVVIDNWRKSASVESIWTKLTTELQPDDLWLPIKLPPLQSCSSRGGAKSSWSFAESRSTKSFV
jgi:hypothetical protein